MTMTHFSNCHLLLLVLAGQLLLLSTRVEADFFKTLFGGIKRQNEKTESATNETSWLASDTSSTTTGSSKSDSNEDIKALLEMDSLEQARKLANWKRPDIMKIREAVAEQNRLSALSADLGADETSPRSVAQPEKAESEPRHRGRSSGMINFSMPDKANKEYYSDTSSEYGSDTSSVYDFGDEYDDEEWVENEPYEDKEERPPLRFINVLKSSDKALDKSQLKSLIKYLPKTNNTRRESRFPKPKRKMFSNLMKKVNKVYDKATEAIMDLPKYVDQATDWVSTVLKLDSKGRLMAMIEDVNDDIKFVRREYSRFTLTWSPFMEAALSYLGTYLEKINCKRDDELDFRCDALHSLAFGYEFIRLMNGWRENLLIAHEAFKLYLETIKEESFDSNKNNNSKEELVVDENFIFYMNTIHAYLLMTAWASIDEIVLEPRTKLDYLMNKMDGQPKNYESNYFRDIVVYQELYEPTINEFAKERLQVAETIIHAGVKEEDLEHVDVFFDNFRHLLSQNKFEGVHWQVPEVMYKFLAKIGPGIQYHRVIYTDSFLKQLKDMKASTMAK